MAETQGQGLNRVSGKQHLQSGPLKGNGEIPRGPSQGLPAKGKGLSKARRRQDVCGLSIDDEARAVKKRGLSQKREQGLGRLSSGHSGRTNCLAVCQAHQIRHLA